jgi:hypothetical protein
MHIFSNMFALWMFGSKLENVRQLSIDEQACLYAKKTDKL